MTLLRREGFEKTPVRSIDIWTGWLLMAGGKKKTELYMRNGGGKGPAGSTSVTDRSPLLFKEKRWERESENLGEREEGSGEKSGPVQTGDLDAAGP